MEIIQFACQKLGFMEGCANPGRQVARPTEFYKMAPNVCESSVWGLLHAYNFELDSRFLETSYALELTFRRLTSTIVDVPHR